MADYRQFIVLVLGSFFFLNTTHLFGEEFATEVLEISPNVPLITPNASNFFITAEQGSAILVACGGLTLSSPIMVAAAGGTIVATGIYLLLHAIREYKNTNKKNAKPTKRLDLDNEKESNQAKDHTCPTPPDDPEANDKDNFFKSLKARANKIARTRFGKMYRDPETLLWWSKDTTRHGGSCYKVFRECAKGFEWLFDADNLGNAIINKHKGPTGLLISYKEVIFLS